MKKLYSLLFTSALLLVTGLFLNNPLYAQIAQRGTATTAIATESTSSITINKPTGIVSGDIMIATITYATFSNSAPSSTGWTLIDNKNIGGNPNRGGAVLYKIAGDTEGENYTFTWSGTGGIGGIIAFSGVDSSYPFDVDPSGKMNVSPSSTTVTGTSITTVTENSAVIMLSMANGAATCSGWAATSPGTLTELFDVLKNTGSYNSSAAAAWAIKGTAGATGNGTATLSQTTENGGILIALRPASPEPPSNILASPVNLQSVLTWTNPSWYDEIVIVGKAGSAVTETPTGNGSAYTANLVFGSGTPFNGGYIVYKGSASPKTVTGLANGPTYYFTLFTRKGTLWSRGITVSTTAPAAAGDYRSVNIPDGGSWYEATTWQYYDGSGWKDATHSPTFEDGVITILNSHVVFVDVPVTVDQVVVENGGLLVLSSNIEIANGTGDDFTVYGTLSLENGVITTIGNLVFGDGGTYKHAIKGGTIPAATWHANSNCNINDISRTAPAGLNQTFGNFTWDCSSQSYVVSLESDMLVNGNFTVNSTGSGSLCMSKTANNHSITVGGDFIVLDPATFKMNTGSSNCTLNIGENLNIAGSSTTGFYLNSSGNASNAIVNVTGDVNVSSGCLNFSASGIASATATLNLTGDFNHTGGAVKNSNAGGSYIGNINFTGTKKQTFNSTGITAGHIINLTVNSGAYLQMGAPGTIVSGAGAFTLQSGATLGITSAAGITSSGSTGNIQTTGTRTFSTGANYIYNGTVAQSTGNGLPATVNSLVFDNSGGTITFDAARAIINNFSISTGSKANLGNGLNHSAGTLTLGGISQPSSSYGHSTSSAITKNDTYFAASTGIVSNTFTAGIWLGLTNNDWNTTSNWSGNFIPNSGTDVNIPSSANQPVISNSPVSGPTAICNNLTINTNASLTVNAGNALTVGGVLSNSGTLNLLSDADGIASLLVKTYTKLGTGTENIQLYLTGGGDEGTYKWHYISIPVNELLASTFTNTTADFALYIESLPVSADPHSFQRGWIAYDNYSYYTLGTNGTPNYGFSTLTSGIGYNYYYYQEHTYKFSGTINTSNLSIPLTSTGSDVNMSGYNLLGNPYACGINIQEMFNNTEIPWPSGTLKAVWFTKDNASCAYSNDVGVPGNVTGLIPPMQGFFVKATTSGTFNFFTDAQEHNNTARYKGDKSSIPLVRLSLSENGKSEETVVRFDNFAKPDVDMDFDAPRIFSTSNSLSIYTTLSGVDFTINGLPFPDKSVEIPVTVNLLTEGNHTITAMELQSLDNYNVTLTDKSNNSVVDLKSVKDYMFTASAGSIKDRFVLTVTNILTGIESSTISEKPFNIYYGFNMINIQTLADDWDGKTGSIRVMDYSGKTILFQQNTEFRKGSLISLVSPIENGLYLVEIRSGIKNFIGKFVAR